MYSIMALYTILCTYYIINRSIVVKSSNLYSNITLPTTPAMNRWLASHTVHYIIVKTYYNTIIILCRIAFKYNLGNESKLDYTRAFRCYDILFKQTLFFLSTHYIKKYRSKLIRHRKRARRKNARENKVKTTIYFFIKEIL